MVCLPAVGHQFNRAGAQLYAGLTVIQLSNRPGLAVHGNPPRAQRAGKANAVAQVATQSVVNGVATPVKIEPQLSPQAERTL